MKKIFLISLFYGIICSGNGQTPRYTIISPDKNIELLPEKNYDISRFVNWTSYAFLPPVVYQLEEFGLPRMISKKIHNSQFKNFIEVGLNIHLALEKLNSTAWETISNIEGLMDFDKYIIDYFLTALKQTADNERLT